MSATDVPSQAPQWLGGPQHGGIVGTSLGGGTPTKPKAVPAAVSTQVLELPKGIVPFEFGIVNIGTSLTASQLYRIIPGSTAIAAQIGVPMAFRGSVVALGLMANAAKTAGTATFIVYINGAATTADLEWTTGETHDLATFLAGEHPFDRGDTVDIRVTTDGSFAPTTVDAEVIAYLAQTQSTSGGA